MSRFKKKNNEIEKILILLLIIFFTSTISIILYDMYKNIEVKDYNLENKYISAKTSAVLEQEIEEENVLNSIEKSTKAVVGISKMSSIGTSIFNINSTKILELGTGVIVSENGYIITNQHVSGNIYSKCFVTLYNGKEYTANVIWANSDIDLAVIKIDEYGLDTIDLGDSESIRIGETVYAIGNPIGLDFQRSVTKGIISAKDRTVKIEEEKTVYMEDLIQTDATINPGNSGGPLINKKGEVIGINSVKITSAEGIGFAIPINIIKPIIEKLKQNGTFNEASIGIFAYDSKIGKIIDQASKFDNGIYVASVNPGSSAYYSGIKIGDIITKIDNIEINKLSKLREYIYTKEPGDTVLLIIQRNQKEMQVEVKLGRL